MRLGIKPMLFRFSCVVCVASLAVCCLAVVRPGLFQKKGETESPPAQEEAVALQKDPLEAYALEKQQLRSMQLSQLDEMISAADTPAETADQARRQKLSLMECMEKEMNLAAELQARGYEDALITISQKSVSVMIRNFSGLAQDVSRVKEAVMAQTQCAAEEIKIIPIN